MRISGWHPTSAQIRRCSEAIKLHNSRMYIDHSYICSCGFMTKLVSVFNRHVVQSILEAAINGEDYEE